MWFAWGFFGLTVLVAFGLVYQDWWRPSRRRVGYEGMRRSVREVQDSVFRGE
jgi:hypothetical protein